MENEKKEGSILHRTSSTLTKASMGCKSMKSVKFVDMPTVCYEYAYEEDKSYDDFDSGKGDEGGEGKRRRSIWNRMWVERIGKKTPTKRPVISGPYRLNSSSPSLLMRREKRDTDQESVKSMGRNGSRKKTQAVFKGWLGLAIGRIVLKFG